MIGPQEASSDDPWPHVVVLDPLTPGLALARTMTRLGACVTVIEDKPFVACSRNVESVIAPYQSGGEAWLQALRGIAASIGPAVVLTGSDRGSELLARAPDLPGNLFVFERAGGAHAALMNKDESARIARRARVNVPWSARITAEDELARAVAEAPWPCVVKPTLSHEWREHYGEERAFLASDAQTAKRLLRAPLEKGLEMQLCQFIPGGDEDVEEAIVVRVGDGSFPVRFGCRKLRQHPPGFGSTALGESSALPETMAIAQRVLDEAGFVGVAGVETKRDPDTGERWFLEVNVRLPAQWGLGDACEVQASRRLVAVLSGRRLGGAPPMRPGVRFVRPEIDWHGVAEVVRAAPALRRPGLLWRASRPYFGARELGVLDVRDPGPLLRLAREFVTRRLRRLAARLSVRRTAKGRIAAGDHASASKRV
jgi:predicted ATP-grasp superfamily ATP-dependent carboligase